MADAPLGKILDAMRDLHPQLETWSFEYGFVGSKDLEAYRSKIKEGVHQFVEKQFRADERLPPQRTIQCVPRDPAYNEEVRSLVIRYLSLEIAQRVVRKPVVH